MNDDFEMAVSKALIKIMNDRNSCFMANVAIRLKYIEDNTQSTAWVNGTEVGINRELFLNLMSAEQRPVVILHEIGHVVRSHLTRGESKDHTIYGWAGDYVINQELKDSGWAPLIWNDPVHGKCHWLQDDRFKGMTTEEVYDILLKEQPPEDQSPPPPPKGATGESTPFDDLKSPQGEEAKKKVEQQMQDIIISSAQAAIMAGKPGSIPGDIQVYLDGLLRPKLPLAFHLRRFFKVLNNTSFTWSRPNRRHQARGLYLPALKGKTLCHIAFAFDMSGSVSDADIHRYVSEVAGVLKELKPTKLTLVQFDTRIISIDEIRSVNELKNLELRGRGGTDVHELMQWANKTKPEALVIFTDGEFYVTDAMDPKIPVLWMIHGRSPFNCPFGQVTKFEI